VAFAKNANSELFKGLNSEVVPIVNRLQEWNSEDEGWLSPTVPIVNCLQE
jgi:hypothetical protein